MKQGKINLGALTTRREPFGNALSVYRDLLQDGGKDIGVVLDYKVQTGAGTQNLPPKEVRGTSSAISSKPAKLSSPVPRLDVIGAGNFARTMLLPHLKEKIAFGTVVNQTALSANHVKNKFSFKNAATNPADIFQQKEPGAVLIATRHHLHAALTQSALAANRHVFVEKPLCLTRDELARIDQTLQASQGTIQVGFNRRFAPASIELKKVLTQTSGAKSASFRIFAGKLDPQHWFANTAESGGRVLGEACHFLDYFCFLFDSKPVRITAQNIGPISERLKTADSVSVLVEFADGSSGQLIYSGEGDPSFPKEALSVYGPGFVAEIFNFQKLIIHRNRKKTAYSYNSKGHAEEMAAWLKFLQAQGEHPLPYEQARTSTLLTFAVLEALQQGRTIEFSDAGKSYAAA
jgi:predicted dehydrogenase